MSVVVTPAAAFRFVNVLRGAGWRGRVETFVEGEATTTSAGSGKGTGA
jgi:hypothetical protein